ncbi:uncharacterized protein LOC115746291 isoform X1 [Rhodamnia argentea]|uniref:Uncharacterized protein LOC115746291 isoform X1 n=1 Tax=Rhodamnia argentea TaxID=178133 RepID=A0A8B8PSV9_9MYRT|nr:uncharacterized protein LOC115746291 isoform X2 [Rhodamnia argentea]XP_030537855.1 uncharacterized protein LOC115746291 isoform X1 [Rhodamnia argentea]
MLTPFICGAFHPEEDDQLFDGTSPRRSSRRSHHQHQNKENKNPYSARGLDKFEALLSDLQEKRQKIYTQKGSSDISLVRFAYTSSNDCVPIVVKKDKANKTKTSDPGATGDHAARNSSDVKEVTERKADGPDKKAKNKSFEQGFMRLENWRRPSYYMPAAILLILLFLAFFGRSVAILCTSIGWYIVPTLKARSWNSSQKPATAKKKELGRRLSENKMVINNNRRSSSPPTNRSHNNSGPDKSPDRHGHHKSW